jgi:hypothetical protein
MSGVFLFAFVMNALADKNLAAIPYATDKTDRTLIKEIALQQEEILRLLREIKSKVDRIKTE